MENVIRDGIVRILNRNQELLKIPVRQRSNFESWLKFELANYLEQQNFDSVEVESSARFGRRDITFFNDENPFSIELKTASTNWKIDGIKESGRPLSRYIDSIIKDTKDLNSDFGIIAFVLFPVPVDDDRWEAYLDKITKETDIELTKEDNCEIVEIDLEESNSCNLVVCTFRSRFFRHIF